MTSHQAAVATVVVHLGLAETIQTPTCVNQQNDDIQWRWQNSKVKKKKTKTIIQTYRGILVFLPAPTEPATPSEPT